MVEFNILLLAFLAIYLLQWGFALWLERLNREHLQRWGDKIPASFEDTVDVHKLAQIRAYTLENSRFAGVAQNLAEALLLGLILSGVLPAVAHLLDDWQLHPVMAGLLFFVPSAILTTAVELPCNYYHTFVIEEKYGFNHSTAKIWVADQIKALLITGVLVAAALSLVLWIITAFPNSWWWWGFVAISLLQLLLVVLYPILIAPLFNTFEPLRDAQLAEQVARLLQAAGIKVSAILQMDAGKRSRHTNAYFTGLGKSKRIVLYDTLLQSHPHAEVLAVLAHEAGHYRGRHILKQLLVFSGFSLAGFFLTYLLLDWPPIYSTFGFTGTPPYVGLFLLSVFWQKAGFFVKPLYMALSRRFEWEADQFAARLLRTSEPMIASFKRLAADNLANLTPHPFYVWFHYSHPTLVERVAWLEKHGYGGSPLGTPQETPSC
jgi:STE24 endopeptidase